MAKEWGQRVQSLLSRWPRSVNASSLCPFPLFVFYGIFGWRSLVWQRDRTLRAMLPGVPQFPSRPRTCAGSAARPRQDVQSRPGSSATPCRRAAKIMNKLLLINTL